MTVQEAVMKEFESRSVDIQPMFPRILVRVLEKEQTAGGIILPSMKQNKPTHEGVVVRVYKPFWQIRKPWHPDWELEATNGILHDEDGKAVRIWKECAVKPGDHILFPHIGYGITPVWPLDDGKGEYRLVEEAQILSRLDYQNMSTSCWLNELLEKADEEGLFLNESVDRILQNADVVRHLEAKTLSGK